MIWRVYFYIPPPLPPAIKIQCYPELDETPKTRVQILFIYKETQITNQNFAVKNLLIYLEINMGITPVYH